jgi:cytochrome bd-type quinol oxidase subunit 2
VEPHKRVNEAYAQSLSVYVYVCAVCFCSASTLSSRCLNAVRKGGPAEVASAATALGKPLTCTGSALLYRLAVHASSCVHTFWLHEDMPAAVYVSASEVVFDCLALLLIRLLPGSLACTAVVSASACLIGHLCRLARV